MLIQDVHDAQILLNELLKFPAEANWAKEFFPRYKDWMQRTAELTSKKMKDEKFDEFAREELKIYVDEKLKKVKEITEEYDSTIASITSDDTPEGEFNEQKVKAVYERNQKLKANDQKYTEYMEVKKKQLQDDFMKKHEIEIEQLSIAYNSEASVAIHYALARCPAINALYT